MSVKGKVKRLNKEIRRLEKRNNKSGFIRFSNISNRNFNCTFNR